MRNPIKARLAIPLLIFPLAAGSAPKQALAQSGYTFEPPVVSLSFRIGAGMPNANDDLFKFFGQQLCTPSECKRKVGLSRGDFRGVALGSDLSIRTTKRLDVVLGVAYDGSSNASEMRAWLDNNNEPIEQTTDFYRVPVTLSAKFYLADRGRRLSKHAWVPNSFTPYVFAGGGATIWGLRQSGDWVDYQTLDVFTRTFEESGAAWAAHAGAGGEWWVSPHVAIVGDGRYTWSKSKLVQDFSDFDKIDLGGLQVTTGLAVRF